MIAVSPTFRPVNDGSRRILSVGTGRREVVRIQLMDEIQVIMIINNIIIIIMNIIDIMSIVR